MSEKPKLMYSTATGSHRKDKPTDEVKTSKAGPIKMRLETAGRGGKVVTVIFNLPFSVSESENLQRSMQSSFGCGGSFKNGNIELRGDMRQKVEDYLVKKGLKVVRAGG